MTTKEKMLKQLVSEFATGGPPTGDEFTINEWAEAAGISNSRANSALRNLVESGKFTMRVGRIGNKAGNIYKPV